MKKSKYFVSTNIHPLIENEYSFRTFVYETLNSKVVDFQIVKTNNLLDDDCEEIAGSYSYDIIFTVENDEIISRYYPEFIRVIREIGRDRYSLETIKQFI